MCIMMSLWENLLEDEINLATIKISQFNFSEAREIIIKHQIWPSKILIITKTV